MLVSCQLLSPSRWHSMRQLERYHPMIEASMSAAGLRMICCRLPLPFLSVAGHAVSRSVRLMYVLDGCRIRCPWWSATRAQCVLLEIMLLS